MKIHSSPFHVKEPIRQHSKIRFAVNKQMCCEHLSKYRSSHNIHYRKFVRKFLDSSPPNSSSASPTAGIGNRTDMNPLLPLQKSPCLVKRFYPSIYSPNDFKCIDDDSDGTSVSVTTTTTTGGVSQMNSVNKSSSMSSYSPPSIGQRNQPRVRKLILRRLQPQYTDPSTMDVGASPTQRRVCNVARHCRSYEEPSTSILPPESIEMKLFLQPSFLSTTSCDECRDLIVDDSLATTTPTTPKTTNTTSFDLETTEMTSFDNSERVYSDHPSCSSHRKSLNRSPSYHGQGH